MNGNIANSCEKISLVSRIKNEYINIQKWWQKIWKVRKIIIKSNLLNGLTLILRSSIKPIKNIE